MIGRSGAYTFLLTDVEGSTALWDGHPGAASEVLRRHEAILSRVVAEHGGEVVKARGEGDSLFCVFERPSDAVRAAVAAQDALAAEPWPDGAEVRVRMALHTGEAELRSGDYYGGTVNRCARLRSCAHGGQVLCTAAVHELTRDAVGDGIAFTDLGLHRLRDLARPEHIFQVSRGEPDDFPPLDTLDVSPHNLPLQPSALIGRDDDLKAVMRLLDAERLVTITGAGGMGKTRLAIQIAAELLDRFEHGVWFVPLETVTDAARVAPAVAAALDLKVEDAPGVVAALRERELLLVIDNAEQVLEGLAFVGDVLATCPGVRVLATSRERLDLRWEREHRLEPMSVPDPAGGATPEGLSVFDSVALFVERAEAARPGFALTHANAAAVAAICARLDGLPLALELAAARVRTFQPDALLEQLDRSLELLAGGPRDSAARHRTIRSTIAWSVDMLGDAERDLFAKLAVFRGGCRADAAADVCGASPEVLSSLAGRSLVRETEDPDGELRYTMLATIRGYAGELLEASGSSEEIAGLHMAWYARWANERVGPGMRGPDTGLWVALLDRELDNIRVATDQLFRSDPCGAALTLAAMESYFTMRGLPVEARDRLTAALDGCTETGVARIEALHVRARFQHAIGDVEAAERDAWAAHDLAEGFGHPVLVFKALNVLGTIYRRTGRHEQAREVYLANREVAESSGEPILVAHAMMQLAGADVASGRLADARPVLLDVIPRFRALGQLPNLIGSLNMLASVEMRLGDAVAARTAMQEAIGLTEEIGGDRTMLMSDLALIERDAGALGDAREIWADVLEHARKSGEEPEIALALANLASVDRITGDVELARAEVTEAVEIARRVGMRYELVYALVTAADLETSDDRAGAARVLVDELAGVVAAWGDLNARVMAAIAESEAALAAGEVDAAAPSASRAVADGRALGDTALIARALLAHGAVRLELGETSGALEAFVEALRTASGTGTPMLEATILTWRARAEAACGDPALAARWIAAAHAYLASIGAVRSALDRRREEADRAAIPACHVVIALEDACAEASGATVPRA